MSWHYRPSVRPSIINAISTAPFIITNSDKIYCHNGIHRVHSVSMLNESQSTLMRVTNRIDPTPLYKYSYIEKQIHKLKTIGFDWVFPLRFKWCLTDSIFIPNVNSYKKSQFKHVYVCVRTWVRQNATAIAITCAHNFIMSNNHN